MDTIEFDNTDLTVIKNIHDFLQNGDLQIKYSPNKDVVLLLGNTGNGKSTLTLYISGNADMLFSREVGENTGQFVIIDKQNKISSESTIVSQTIYPDLVEDTETNILYYDCPGFSDTRSAAHEMAATYFIKKIIDSARSVKMVFVVSHNSVSTGEDRQDFILMLQHATELIQKMDKFKNSIALVVTKIENRYVRNSMVADDKIITAISNYLEQAKRDIDQHPEIMRSDSKEKVLVLLDIFLSRSANEEYPRIGIFRKPTEIGPISDIELMKDCKIALENLINNNIQFAKVDDEDFGYTVSAKSKVFISGLVEEINKTIFNKICDIGNEVEEYCISLEEKNSELQYLVSTFQKLQESFLKIKDSAIEDAITPEQFINEIDNNIKHFKINISHHHFKILHSETDYINFFNLVSNQSIKNHKSSLLAAGLSKLTEHLNGSHSFYSLLNNIYQRLSQFDIQKNRNTYGTLNIKELNDLIESPIFKEIEYVLKEHSDIKNMKLNNPKIKLLNTVLDWTLRFQIEVTSPEINKIIVKGVNVKMSDLIEIPGIHDVRLIEIYALHKMFIDSTLDLTGKEIQIAIAAPVWEVIGNQSIILDGKPGIDHNPQKAGRGREHGEKGCDGLCGEPGGPAGNFIGIGKQFINEEYLHISASGGKGGRGQDGGDGADGYSGSNSNARDKKPMAFLYENANRLCPGGRGGDGGHGGVGGYGGNKGFIYVIKVGTESEVVGVKQTCTDGHPGEDGKGGNGGKGGQFYCFKVRNYAGIVGRSCFNECDRWAENGTSGGLVIGNKKETWILPKLINLSNSITKYKQYLQSNIIDNLQKTFLEAFLSEIDNNHRLH